MAFGVDAGVADGVWCLVVTLESLVVFGVWCRRWRRWWRLAFCVDTGGVDSGDTGDAGDADGGWR